MFMRPKIVFISKNIQMYFLPVKVNYGKLQRFCLKTGYKENEG